MTRSFGDFHAKRPELGGNGKVVIAEHGKMTYLTLDGDGDVSMLVLASDGIWDALTPEEVLQKIEKPGALQPLAPPSGGSKSNAVAPAAEITRYIEAFAATNM